MLQFICVSEENHADRQYEKVKLHLIHGLKDHKHRQDLSAEQHLEIIGLGYTTEAIDPKKVNASKGIQSISSSHGKSNRDIEEGEAERNCASSGCFYLTAWIESHSKYGMIEIQKFHYFEGSGTVFAIRFTNRFCRQLYSNMDTVKISSKFEIRFEQTVHRKAVVTGWS